MATPDWAKKEVRANYANASRAGRHAERTEPRAVTAAYLAGDEALRIVLTNGASLTVPIQLIPGLQHAAIQDIKQVEVLGRGGGLHWESLDLDLSVPGLVASLFAGPGWMAELGRSGGQRASAAKAVAARKNGRKGGRPKSRAPTAASS
jgi:hypothetical protein